MRRIRYRPQGVMTAREARELGVQLNDDVEQAFGITKDRRTFKKVLVRPADFVIDRFDYVEVNLDHINYKNNNEH